MLMKSRQHALKNLSVLLLASVSYSANALLVVAEDKKIEIRQAQTLIVDIEPIKATFTPNEKIRLRTKGNKPYYLYLFNVDPQTGEAIMLLPNSLQTNNYYSQQAYIVPHRDIEFYSDREGSEQMIMVASTKKMEVNAENYQTIDTFIAGKSQQFEKSLGIRFDAPKKATANPDVLVKSFRVNIEARVKPQTEATKPSFFNGLFGQTDAQIETKTPELITFIASSKNKYNDGDTFDVVYGANSTGYVHVYSIDPFGAYDLVKVTKVDGKSVQTLKLNASAPYGNYTLMVLFNKKEAINYKNIEGITLNKHNGHYSFPDKKISKGLTLKSTQAIAVQNILIQSPSLER